MVSSKIIRPALRAQAFAVMLTTVAGLAWASGLSSSSAPPRARPASPSVSTSVVINEVDYDQTGTDNAEYIELKNVSGGSIQLDTYTVQLVNGNAGGAAIYQTITLPTYTLPAGDYYVICANSANTPNCDMDVTPDSNLIQNGAPDAIGLRDGGTLVDAVSYEGNTGAPYTEGSGTGLIDNDASTTRAFPAVPTARTQTRTTSTS